VVVSRNKATLKTCLKKKKKKKNTFLINDNIQTYTY
jgi:hypothetical protein